MRRWGLILCTLLALASWTVAAEEPSLERGKELFNTALLGETGKSCASCHLGGRRLERVSGANDSRVVATANQCLTTTLRAEPLPPDSVEMRSLLLYMKNL